MAPHSDTSPIFSETRNPIFVIGILQRSGTNYLNNLLLLHPDVKSPGLVWEDFYLAPAEHLQSYVEEMRQCWSENWWQAVEIELGHNAPLRYLGDGLISFMQAQYKSPLGNNETPPSDQQPIRLVTATPSARNLELFFELFPQAALLIIVRDGRAVVESGMRSFGWDYEVAIRMWVEGAKQIIAIRNNSHYAGQYLLTRYEDLYLHTEEEMHRIIEFLKLNISCFDFHAAINMGLMGSSELMHSEKHLHWKYREKPINFNPLERAEKWGRALHERFNWIAGSHMRALGYEPRCHNDNVLYWSAWNRLLDWLYSLEIKVHRHASSLSKMLYWLRHRLVFVGTPRSSKAKE